MNTNAIAINDFESPCVTARVITLAGKSATYNLREMTAQETEDIFTPLRTGTEDQKAKASIAARVKLIAACVTREDGTAITVEQARKFRAPLVAELERAAMEVNGLSGDQAGNASPPENASGT